MKHPPNCSNTAFERRRVNGSPVMIDNRWVVPYNPYLTKRYRPPY
jgi:hypothetical protein